MEQPVLDPKRQKKAREYARIRRRLMLVDLLIGTAYLLAWLLFGWALALREAISNLTSSPWLLLTGFIAVFGGIYYIINLPLAYYSGFVLPHRYDLSNETLRGWIIDQIKGLLLAAVLGLILVQVIYFVLRSAPGTWWIWAAAVMLFFNVILANLAPVLIAPIFYKFEPLHESRADLAGRLTLLAQQANVHVRGVYKFDMSRRTKAANAALFGLGNTRRIILGDTLLNEFGDDEIETILAHELGHHAHYDIPLGIFTSTVITVVGLFLAAQGLRFGIDWFGFNGPGDVAAMPLLALIIGAFGLVTMPLENAFSRWRERLADRYALDSTRKPWAFASAMTRLANQNLAVVDPEPWVEFLLYSHPALEKRIRMAEQYQPARE